MSKIEWTNETWNPIIGCTKISEGCKNCYAEKMANRLAKIKSTCYYISVLNPLKIPMEWSGECSVIYRKFLDPLKWNKPRMIFVCSMGDLFHESLNFNDILDIFFVMEKCPQHTFQILTKRPERMMEFINWSPYPFPSKNVWLGVTAENQEQANKRVPILLDIPAAKRFVSCEPLLSDIDFPWFDYQKTNGTILDKIDWVIAGPETGPNKRPMQKEWIQNIYNQCKRANVPFFDKKNTLEMNLKQFPNE